MRSGAWPNGRGASGFLLHASSAVRDGRAFVFTGPSGAGKSTIVGLVRNVLFFADDRQLVGRVLDTACDFASRVPAFKLLFAPDRRSLA